MGSFSEEEYRFFDASEDIASISDAKSDGTVTPDGDCCSSCGILNGFDYEVWAENPRSVQERRSKFRKWMGLSLDQITFENSVDVCSLERAEEINRLNDSCGTVTTTSGFEEEFCSSRSSMSCWSSLNTSEEFVSLENGDLDKGVHRDGDQEEHCVEIGDGRGVGSNHLMVSKGPGDSEDTNILEGRVKNTRSKSSWFRKLRSMTCMIDSQHEADNGMLEGTRAFSGGRIQKVKVRQYKKKAKELSGLYMGQDIQAHEGSILTMKFSPDGRYLASAGEDGVVRLWQVIEDERCDEIDIPEIDPSSIYFTVNHLSELTPLFVDKEKISKQKSLKKTSDSACVIFPPKVFRLLEKPLHEFHGHRGDILDLSWSKNNYLLSSSIDNTVRLWKVGYDHCLEVFSHSNYVTCIQFNPVDDNYFISGSIDGKVRIWAIPDCHVVDWIDIREIVTAVCYRPDGQGGIIGSMTGSCRFYNVAENRLQLDAQLCLFGKKKLPCRGITGFQYLPQNSSKVMVTGADSQVRILHGLNVIGKYKGLSAGSQVSASFTSDGKHILSACEDSNIYLWNVSQEESVPTKAKNIRSCERFFSNASVVVPWCGLKSQNSENEHRLDALDQSSPQTLRLTSPACFSLGQEFFLESFPKGSATWPEEHLPTSSPKAKTPALHKSQYKFFKSSCKSTTSTHAWGMVIVTAGLDGRIKSFHSYGLPVPV